jgi:hypothetical protein
MCGERERERNNIITDILFCDQYSSITYIFTVTRKKNGMRYCVNSLLSWSSMFVTVECIIREAIPKRP